MKTNSFKLLLISSFLALFFVACESDDNGDVVVPEVSTGVFVLNQGSWHQNNSSISYYDFTTKTTTSDIFSAANDRGLGDGGQDALLYGSNLYVTVTESSVLEVIDPKTGVSKKSISLMNGNVTRQPRSMAALNGKIYITLFDGNVAKFDTTTLAVETILPVGPNPEGIVAANNLLYVAISGGRALVNDSTVSVIDPATFKELRKIKVIINPTKITADSRGNIYVISNGNYGSIKSTLQRIDVGTEKVTAILGFQPWNFTMCNDNLYLTTYDYESYLAVNKKYYKYNTSSDSKVMTEFIPATAITNTPYSLDVDPTNGDIYVGETDYANTGKVNVFKADGTSKTTVNVGVNPCKTLFLTK